MCICGPVFTTDIGAVCQFEITGCFTFFISIGNAIAVLVTTDIQPSFVARHGRRIDTARTGAPELTAHIADLRTDLTRALCPRFDIGRIHEVCLIAAPTLALFIRSAYTFFGRFTAVGSNAVTVVAPRGALACTADAVLAIVALMTARTAMLFARSRTHTPLVVAVGQLIAALERAYTFDAQLTSAAGIKATSAVVVVVHEVFAFAVAQSFGRAACPGIGFVLAVALITNLFIQAGVAAASAIGGIRLEVDA